MPSKIFCPHGYAPKCHRCKRREFTADLVNLVLYALAVAIVVYVLLTGPADAVRRCFWAWVDNEPSWVCVDEREVPAEWPDPAPAPVPVPTAPGQPPHCSAPGQPGC